MKKSIISAIALLSLAACMQEEVVSVNHTDAIVFDNAFVENATRATTSFDSKEDLGKFNVWGFVNSPETALFNGTEVVKGNNGVWSYAGESRYWIPGQDYYFAAVAPVCDSYRIEKFTETDLDLIFTNVDGNEDLIYAENHVVAKESGQNVPVAFQFQHLLSKVRFTFENKMGNEYINVRISDIKMKSISTASVDLKADPKVWVPQSEQTVTLNFGSLDIIANDQEHTEDYFVIPSERDYEIEFGVELVKNGINGTEILYTAKKTAIVPGNSLEMGIAYNFSTAITPDMFDRVPYSATDGDGRNDATEMSKTPSFEVSRDLVINHNGETSSHKGSERIMHDDNERLDMDRNQR